MIMHPDIGSQNSRERQREMMAQAERWRLERQLRDLARASRRAEAGGRTRRRTRRAVSPLTRLLPRRWAAR